jgi:hypothetical protein
MTHSLTHSVSISSVLHYCYKRVQVCFKCVARVLQEWFVVSQEYYVVADSWDEPLIDSLDITGTLP